MATGPDYAHVADEIFAKLDVIAEFQALGVEIVGTPRNGKCECKAFGRSDSNPSAVIFIESGRYLDSGTGDSCSLFDFAVRHGGGRFADWRAARKHYADKAGVKLAGGKPKESSLDKIELIEWDNPSERLANIWCVKHKRGLSLEAVKLAGGRAGFYPLKIDAKTGEKSRDRNTHKVVALPCFGERSIEADPLAYTVWRIDGSPFLLYRGKDVPKTEQKMLSAGATAGTLMNRHALMRLALDESSKSPIEAVILAAGPTDMLSILTAQIAAGDGSESRFPVVAMASGEAGNVHPWQAQLLARRKVIQFFDRDSAGSVGAAKWAYRLLQAECEVVNVSLPFPLSDSHGKDSRDFLLGEAIETEAKDQAA